MSRTLSVLSWIGLCLSVISTGHAQELKPVRYNNPGLTVDLGVGLWAWPIPMDYDQDGDWDLVVSCPDKPSNGTYFFENPGKTSDGLPVFLPGRKIGPGHRNIRVSHIDGVPLVLTPGKEYPDFRATQFARPVDLGLPANLHTAGRKIRANQWQRVDFDGDGRLDVVVAVGDWADYRWDDAYNDRGEWTTGPLRGYVYVVRDLGPQSEQRWARPIRLRADDADLEVFGWPSPNFADFDGDGDLDLICGEFLDGFTYFENVGSRQQPRYTVGRKLRTADGSKLTMDLQMIVPSAVDWDSDGDVDLIVGDEDGRVAFVENAGQQLNSTPVFKRPVYFQQQADVLKFGALATPTAIDWDQDGDADLLCGNTAGYIGWFENLSGGPQPRWAGPRLLKAGGQVIRIQAGPHGSIQGPCEAKWGYTTLTAGDWDHDGLPDLVANSIWGAVIWFRNSGTPGNPQLEAGRPIEVQWPDQPPSPTWNWWKPRGNQLVTQWRTTPVIVDWNRDGANDLVMLDHEGYLALFARDAAGGHLRLHPGQRIFVDENGKVHRLNNRSAGGSGRRKLAVTDWNGDGRLDILVNSRNASLLVNEGDDGTSVRLRDAGPLSPTPLAGHTSSPTTVDWNQDGIPDLLVGAEDGRLYHMLNPRTSAAD